MAIDDKPSRSLKALLSAVLIDNLDGTYTLDISGETGKVRAKVIDDSKSVFRRLLRQNPDGTFSLATNVSGVSGGGQETKIIDWINATDKYFQFEEGSLSLPKNTTATANVLLTNAHGDINTFNSVDSVTAFLTIPGSAVLTTAQPVTVTDGRVIIQVTDAIAETVQVGLMSPSTVVDVTDTLNITFT